VEGRPGGARWTNTKSGPNLNTSTPPSPDEDREGGGNTNNVAEITTRLQGKRLHMYAAKPATVAEPQPMAPNFDDAAAHVPSGR
jgi:hypothetical protein